MREKLGALIQFLAVIVAFILVMWGVIGGYQEYCGSEVVAIGKVMTHLIGALVGVGIGIGGVILGSLTKK